MRSVRRGGLSAAAALAVALLLAQPAAAPPEPPPPFLNAFGSSGSGNGEFDDPEDVAVNPVTGLVYVVDSASHRVQVFTGDGTFVDEWGGPGILDGDFAFPQGIAVDPLTGDVYVADTANSRVQKLDADGNHLATYGGPLPMPAFVPPTFDSTDGFVVPSDIAVNPASGKVYVADSGNNRIMRFDSGLSYESKWGLPGGAPGIGDGEFVFPTGLAVDFATGEVHVTDNGNNRVQKFTAGGGFVDEWGSPGSGDGEFDGPNGPSTGSVFVADTGNDRIQKFTPGGGFLTKWGSSGSDPGEFDDPTGTATSPWGHVYVADSGNDRVQRFGPSPATLVVDDDTFATAADCDAPYPSFALASIQAAVDFAQPGDTILVCPGLYPEHVVVDKRLTLTGPGKTGAVNACNTPAAPSPATQAIVRGSTAPGDPTLRLEGDRILLQGFVVESAADGPGIVASPARSGHTLRRNVVQGNQGGLLLDTSGSFATLVTGNCFRQNNDPGPHSGHGVRSTIKLRSARIDLNLFFDNDAWAVSLEAAPAAVSVNGNKSRQDGGFARVAGSSGSRVNGNIVLGQTTGPGVLASAGNSRLEVKGNIVKDGVGDGVAATGAPPNTALNVGGNILRDLSGDGIDVAASSSTAGVVKGNIGRQNGGDGLKIANAGNAGHAIAGNIFRGNTGHGCHDSTTGTATAGTANGWAFLGNICDTQNRAGLSWFATTTAPVHPATH